MWPNRMPPVTASQDTLDTKLFRRSVDAVTGGMLKWNGQSMIAPVRGMTQDALGGDPLMVGR